MPDPKKKQQQLQDESSRERDIRQLAREARRQQDEIDAANEAPSGRSVIESTTNPTLAERILPGNRTGQQAIRQGGDLVTSMLGGAVGGGIPGAVGGGLSSAVAGAINPNQAQELGSWTNLANLVLPGVNRVARAPGVSKMAAKAYPALTNAVLGGAEAGAQGLASASDSGRDPAFAVGGAALLGGALGGLSGHAQSRGREFPTAVSPAARREMVKLAEREGRVPANQSSQDLLNALTSDLTKGAPYMRTASEEMEDNLTKAVTTAKLSKAEANLPEVSAKLSAADDKLFTLKKQAAVDKAEMEQAIKLERARSLDFIKSFPAKAEELETEIKNLQSNGKAFQDAFQRKEKLQEEFKLSTEMANNEAFLRERVKVQKGIADVNFNKLIRDASQQVSVSSSAFDTAKREVNQLAAIAKSDITREEVRAQALDKLVMDGIRDPRRFTPEAAQAVRVLTKDPKFSPQSLFEKTLEAADGSELLTKGLMDAIGNDPLTKTALRTRYTQHVFDKFQQGESDNVFGKTFKPAEFVKYVQGINPRAFNNFMESSDAYGILFGLAERLRKGAEGLDHPSLGLRLAPLGIGTLAFGSAHLMNSNSDESLGGFLLKLGTVAAIGGAANRLISWKSITNDLLQAKGERAKAIRSFLEAEDPTRLPQGTLKIALRTLIGASKPVANEEAEE